MSHTFERSRLDRLIDLTGHSAVYMSSIARTLKCPEPSVRVLIQQARVRGYVIELENKAIRNYGLRRRIVEGSTGAEHVPF